MGWKGNEQGPDGESEPLLLATAIITVALDHQSVETSDKPKAIVITTLQNQLSFGVAGVTRWEEQRQTRLNLSLLLFAVRSGCMGLPLYNTPSQRFVRGAYMCFRCAGGKLIIVMRPWACSYGKGAV